MSAMDETVRSLKALTTLLIDKGVITEEELVAAYLGDPPAVRSRRQRSERRCPTS
jgi:hypothetical protein